MAAHPSPLRAAGALAAPMARRSAPRTPLRSPAWQHGSSGALLGRAGGADGAARGAACQPRRLRASVPDAARAVPWWAAAASVAPCSGAAASAAGGLRARPWSGCAAAAAAVAPARPQQPCRGAGPAAPQRRRSPPRPPAALAAALAAPPPIAGAAATAVGGGAAEAFAVVLGYMVLVGSLFRSAPQIVKVVRARSCEGLSLTSVIVELLCYSVVVAYNLSQQSANPPLWPER
ncbi:hypothetical protein Rsub_01772 [Raphidocelis subcapitata]|uniref:Uncharacterized protein n=1 Tax=Raphidocelis subcapitata TaxID=307507 RepID=A0A2V0NW66_9CHLO|nr:hypothetical protein Rsub_01772 [Raphidocelis subcapitata]|eukprot:GBF89055.1 hypothetical protein Rsub_01772 [Raphidocelis subcapitata]